MRALSTAAVLVACLLPLADARSTWARPIRRLFEPTDLELENPGVLEMDLQMGLVRGHDPYRLVVPDFEVQLGVTPQVQLEIDGAVAIEDRAGETFAFDHLTPDDLWLSAKVGLADFRLDEGHGDDDPVLALGFQLGPKLPTAREAEGLGIEGLGLVGLSWRKTQVILNLGGLLDPGVGRVGRPAGVEGGLDLDQSLDAGGRWDLTGELGGVLFFSSDADQLTATTGVTYHASAMLDLSVVGLAGLTRGSDRWGVLLGISPKFRLWGHG